ncbi:serine--tRNA ligase [Candidatus Hydrogenosomobacter endosymbioticus]|uniref:Serine--tRNA ligase n=1 Tax=Candidatus Hydrogenosomobacter endosymbioticus TaxID=2558174 RepID=A0ABN6L2A5_9PROT|nr:serine--tRNA ligase [Candidatus Hydrogenosomobacter endosymbioticus]BDB95966.1 serine--tRNA ligase [Candidatus Hydrogenosomobacter endosymbioticus]
MIDLKWIRENADKVDRSMAARGSGPISGGILDLDEKSRKAITELQEIRTKRNKLASEIGALKSKRMDCGHLISEAEKFKRIEDELASGSNELSCQLRKLLLMVPNILDETVPIGAGEEDNVEVRKFGVATVFPWTKDHMEIGKSLSCIDFESAAKFAGARFGLLRGQIAHMERALLNWMIDLHVSEAGFMEVATPYLVKEEALIGSGNLPKFKGDLFETTDGRFLIPTAEVSLVNMFREQAIDESELPIHVVAGTPCFRSEAGSAGKDTYGMIRMHQFHKVELVSVCRIEDCARELEFIVSRAERVLQLLDIPYRVVTLCSSDTGFTASKTYDLEVWLPGQNKYREISSCSNCKCFQARRAQIRVRGKSGSLSYAGTLNGSGIAVGRALIAVLENYQQQDGSVVIPNVLRPYMDNKERIERS